MTGTGILVLQFLSWAATAMGLFPLVQANSPLFMGEGEYALYVAIVLAGLSSFAIQWTLSLAWRTFFERPLKRPIAFAVALSCSLASGSFAAASWIAFTDALSVKKTLTAERTAASVTPMQEFSNRFYSLSTRATMLSELANQRERHETEKGGSCTDDPKPSTGPGKRQRLRQNQKQVYADLSVMARRLADKAETIMVRFQPGSSKAELADAYLSARRLLRDGDVTQMTVLLSQQAEGFESGWRNEATGATFTCADARMQSAVAELLASINEPTDLPSTPPTPAEVGFQEALQTALAKIGALLSGDFSSFGSQSSSNLGLFFAFAVEFILIWQLSEFVGRRKQAGLLGSPIDVFLDSQRKLSDEEKTRLGDLIPLLHTFTIFARGKQYFAIPVDGDPDMFARLMTLQEQLDLKPDPIAGEGIDLEAIEPGWVRARTHLHGNATMFRLYTISPDVLDWRRRKARDVGPELYGMA